MSKYLDKTLLAGVLAATLVPSAHAVILGFDPAESTVSVPGTVTIDLVAELEGDDTAISAYDVDILFDDALLSLMSVSEGPALGLGLFDQSLTSPSTLDVAATSFEDVTTLEALQADAIVLASLVFEVDGLAAGDSTTVFFNADDPNLLVVGGPDGIDPLANVTLNTHIITAAVEPPDPPDPPNPVPLPASLSLALLGLGVAATARGSRDGARKQRTATARGTRDGARKQRAATARGTRDGARKQRAATARGTRDGARKQRTATARGTRD